MPDPTLKAFAHRLAKADSATLKKLNVLVRWTSQILSDIDWMDNADAADVVVYPRHMTEMAYLEWFRMTGEAANKLPEEIKAQHPEVPWKEFIKIRNKVAHMDEPDKRKWLQEYIGTQKDKWPEIETIRNNISDITLDESAPANIRETLQHLKDGINLWALGNAFHFRRKDQFLASLTKAEEKASCEELFETMAQIEFRSALNILKIMEGNLSVHLSLLFKETGGNLSGYNDLSASFKDIRNVCAHNDLEAKKSNPSNIPYDRVWHWVQKNNSTANLEKMYLNRLNQGLLPGKKHILDDTVGKITAIHFKQNEPHQVAYLLALSHVGKGISADLMKKVANVTLPLARAKAHEITIAHLDAPTSQPLPDVIRPFVQSVVTSMQTKLGMAESLAVA